MTGVACSVVVPTVGRPSLAPLLRALRTGTGPAPAAVVVVDDRRQPDAPLDVGPGVLVLRSGGRGPAAARNAGWRAVSTQWVVFLDDDVLPPPAWAASLADDLAGLPESVVGSQGRLRVPLPADRRPTDWERGTAGLAGARWATADMAYRRAALERVGGFDERFPRAYREDAELALRMLASGFTLVRGARETTHPVRPASRWASVRAQRGNADDALVRRLHGRSWLERAGAPAGRLRRHAAIAAAGLLGLGGLAAGRLAPAARRPAVRRIATLAGVGGAVAWAVGTGELALRRIAPGPRTPSEVGTMVATSVVIPPVAVAHRLRGELASRHVRRWVRAEGRCRPG